MLGRNGAQRVLADAGNELRLAEDAQLAMGATTKERRDLAKLSTIWKLWELREPGARRTGRRYREPDLLISSSVALTNDAEGKMVVEEMNPIRV